MLLSTAPVPAIEKVRVEHHAGRLVGQIQVIVEQAAVPIHAVVRQGYARHALLTQGNSAEATMRHADASIQGDMRRWESPAVGKGAGAAVESWSITHLEWRFR